jgi:NAD+ diphosphatase
MAAAPMAEMPFEQPANYRPGLIAPATPPASALWFVFRRSELLVRSEPAPPALPRTSHPQKLGVIAERIHYLGRLSTEHCFAAEVCAEAVPPEGWSFHGLRALFNALDDSSLALAGRARQIIDWDRTHLFCGACGQPTNPRRGERSRECASCGVVVYPRLAPVVMCLVRRERSLLLARSPRFAPGMFSAIAGFVEPGETLEQCVRREVEEEVGVRVAGLRYFASQPWPFPHSLMIAFFGEYGGGEIRVDGVEIEAAEWFTAGNLPRLPARISVARKLIDAAIGEIAAP